LELNATITVKGPVFEGNLPILATQRNLDRAMSEAVALLERKVKENIRKAPRIGVGGAKGGLLASIHGETIQKGTPLIKGIVATQSIYGEVIEKGRRPGKKMPPEDALDRWIDKKIGTTRRSFKSVDQVMAYVAWKKSISFLIRRKIGQKGFPGIHMFERAWNENLPQIQNIFESAGFEIVRELNGK
jgi:hypothetical protein